MPARADPSDLIVRAAAVEGAAAEASKRDAYAKMCGHPHVRALLADFVSAVLVDQPADVFAYARRHFGAMCREVEQSIGGAHDLSEDQAAALLQEIYGQVGVEDLPEDEAAAVLQMAFQANLRPPRKEEWPELLGSSDPEAAMAAIQRDRSDLTVQVIPAGSMVSMDYCEDRVRIFVDALDRVQQIPQIG